jgi:hypothetical protein
LFISSDLGLEFYDGIQKIAVAGLSIDDRKRRPRVRDAVLGILGSHVGMGLNGRDSDSEEREGHARELAILCVRVCLRLDSTGFLSMDLFEMFQASGVETVFLTEIVNAVGKGQVGNLVNPLLVNRICDVFGDELEDVVVRLDPACLDINYVFGVCMKRGHVVSLIYLYTVAMRDFQGPIVEVYVQALTF